MTKWYFGPRDRTAENPPQSKFEDIVIFKSNINPTFGSHGDKVRYCFGPYNTRNETLLKARYQFPVIRRFVDLNDKDVIE